MNLSQKIIKPKLGLLQLAKQLGSASENKVIDIVEIPTILHESE